MFFWGWVRERAITFLGSAGDCYTCITCKQTVLSNLLHEWFRQMKIKEQILANGKSYHTTNEAKLLEFGPRGQIRNGLVFTAMFLMNKPPQQNVTWLLVVPQSAKHASIPKYPNTCCIYKQRQYHVIASSCPCYAVEPNLFTCSPESRACSSLLQFLR